MLLIDVLASVAAEELARLREEEQRKKKKMQHMAEPIRICRLKRTERRRTNVVSDDDDDDDDDDDYPVSLADHDGHLPGTRIESKRKKASGDDDDYAVSLADHDDHLPGTSRIESKPEKVTPLKFKLSLKKKKKEIGKVDGGDGGSEKNKGKAEVNNGHNPLPDSPTKFTNKKRKPGTDNVTDIPSLDLATNKKSKQQQAESDNGHNISPVLPAKFRKIILEKAQGRQVGEEVLVIQKELTSTDLGDHQNRLSIPLNQRRNKFLSEKDEEFLKGRDASGHYNGIDVAIIEPEGKIKSVNLSRWVMNKLSGKPSISYVLNGEGWKKIKTANKLKVGNVVQLWAVQIEGEPCLVFVKLN